MSKDLVIDPEVRLAFQRLTDEDDDTSWILCGYKEGNSTMLEVIGEGTGGMPELIANMPSSIVWGAFKVVGVDDREGSAVSYRPRFVFIKYIPGRDEHGADIPPMRRARTGGHKGEIKQVIQSNIDIEIESPADLTEELVISKFSTASGPYPPTRYEFSAFHSTGRLVISHRPHPDPRVESGASAEEEEEEKKKEGLKTGAESEIYQATTEQLHNSSVDVSHSVDADGNEVEGVGSESPNNEESSKSRRFSWSSPKSGEEISNRSSNSVKISHLPIELIPIDVTSTSSSMSISGSRSHGDGETLRCGRKSGLRSRIGSQSGSLPTTPSARQQAQIEHLIDTLSRSFNDFSALIAAREKEESAVERTVENGAETENIQDVRCAVQGETVEAGTKPVQKSLLSSKSEDTSAAAAPGGSSSPAFPRAPPATPLSSVISLSASVSSTPPAILSPSVSSRSPSCSSPFFSSSLDVPALPLNPAPDSAPAPVHAQVQVQTQQQTEAPHVTETTSQPGPSPGPSPGPAPLLRRSPSPHQSMRAKKIQETFDAVSKAIAATSEATAAANATTTARASCVISGGSSRPGSLPGSAPGSAPGSLPSSRASSGRFSIDLQLQEGAEHTETRRSVAKKIPGKNVLELVNLHVKALPVPLDDTIYVSRSVSGGDQEQQQPQDHQQQEQEQIVIEKEEMEAKKAEVGDRDRNTAAAAPVAEAPVAEIGGGAAMPTRAGSGTAVGVFGIGISQRASDDTDTGIDLVQERGNDDIDDGDAERRICDEGKLDKIGKNKTEAGTENREEAREEEQKEEGQQQQVEREAEGEREGDLLLDMSALSGDSDLDGLAHQLDITYGEADGTEAEAEREREAVKEGDGGRYDVREMEGAHAVRGDRRTEERRGKDSRARKALGGEDGEEGEEEEEEEQRRDGEEREGEEEQGSGVVRRKVHSMRKASASSLTYSLDSTDA